MKNIMIKKILIFCLIFISSHVYSQTKEDLFGVWNISFRDSEISYMFEVEFTENIVTFHYEDSEPAQYSYYFKNDDNNFVFLFIGQLGYYYESIDINNFILVPAFDSNISSIRFER